MYVVVNTFFGLLSQERQVRCFSAVAAHLEEGGAFVLEAFVPDPSRFGRGSVRVTQIGDDEVRLEASRHDPVAQQVTSQQVVISEQAVRFYPSRLRYAWPAELDLMARLAGLHLAERWATGTANRSPPRARSTSRCIASPPGPTGGLERSPPVGEPHVLLRGEQLGLGLPRTEMFAEYHRWESEPAAIAGFGAQFPELYEVRAAGYESQARLGQQARFEVVRLVDGEPVGVTVLQIDHRVRTAEYAILMAPHARGHGYAAEATRLTLDWAFHLAAARMVWLKVLEHNTAGIRAYERAGFRHAGRLRRAGYWLGQPCDELLMDVVPGDFPGPSAVAGFFAEGRPTGEPG